MCPSSATVTSFFTMVAGLKAKASEVNTNWSTFRGHSLPVDPTLSAAANNSYDLGATDHQWRKIYSQYPPYVGGNPLGQIRIANVYDGTTPVDIVDDVNDLGLVAFRYDSETDIRFQFIVPNDYVPGSRISLVCKGYPETAASAVFESMARLYKVGSVVSSVPAAVLTTTATFGCSVAGTFFSESGLRLTNASGVMNSVTVTVGDVITVGLKRKTGDTSDTNTGYVYLTDFIVDLNN